MNTEEPTSTGEILAAPLSRSVEPCPYLPGLRAEFEHYLFVDYDMEGFQRSIEDGFRHFGQYFFRPACPGAGRHCGACLPVRVRVNEFEPSKSQRRVLRRGGEVKVAVERPQCSREKFEIYLKHKERFPTERSDEKLTLSGFERLFYDNGPMTWECTYTLQERMVGVGLIDIAPRAMSSIYFFFDPEFAELSPGTLSVLYELGLARSMAIPYYYLGYVIHANRSMRYKMEFRPCEYYDGAHWRGLREGKTFLADPAAIRTGRFAPLMAAEGESEADMGSAD